MSIDSPEDLKGLERAGRITRLVLNAMKAAVRPGISTLELDAVAGCVMRKYGAKSAPRMVYGFPGETCISVNDEVVHGIPSSRKLKAGDLVKMDVTVEIGGYMGDACETVAVPPVRKANQQLIQCAQQAFHRGLERVKPGIRAYEIGAAIQHEVERQGYSVAQDLAGHGIGHTIHEAPIIPNCRDLSCSDLITEGLVFTIEPIITAGGPRVVTKRDEWTIRTRDRSFAAHYEHTLVVTASGARLLTA